MRRSTQLAVAEQARVRVGAEERVPLEARLDDQHLALGRAGRARRRADRVAGLERQQRLVAVDDVERLRAALQMRGELFEPELHRDPGGRALHPYVNYDGALTAEEMAAGHAAMLKK